MLMVIMYCYYIEFDLKVLKERLSVLMFEYWIIKYEDYIKGLLNQLLSEVHKK
jgi:hypothetical protein